MKHCQQLARLGLPLSPLPRLVFAGFAAFPSDPYWAAGGAASDPEGLARRRGGYGGMDGEGDHTGGDGEGAESDGPWAGVAGAGIGLEERAPRTATASSRYSEVR